MSDKLSSMLWVEPKAKPVPAETRVEQALARALANTTPFEAGTPWERSKKEVNLPTESQIHEEVKTFIGGAKSELPMGDSELMD